MSGPIFVTKASGENESFDEGKLTKSLLYTGVNKGIAQEAVDSLKGHLKNGITTHSIHHFISQYLKQNTPPIHYYNYSLKRAVMDLGPEGHAFEVLISELLRLYDYKTEVGVTTMGKCVTHEIDVIAKREDRQYFIECKFHNNPGTKTDVQVALYTYARFLDVKFTMEKHRTKPDVKYFPWLITNTKATSDGIDYAKCVGLELTSWTYPEGRGVSDLIMKSNLHPITIIDSVSHTKIHQLLERGIITCKQLHQAILQGNISDILNREEISMIKDNLKDFPCNE